MGLGPEEEAALGPERAAKVRCFRLLIHLGQELRFLADTLYREDGVTAQQAMLLGIVDMIGEPSLTEVATATATSHQNVKQIVNALVKKGLLRMKPDPEDARVKRLSTTPKNKRHWKARDRDDLAVVATWFSALSGAEAEQLQKLLFALEFSVGGAVRGARGG